MALSDPRLSNPRCRRSQDAEEVLLWSRKEFWSLNSLSLSPNISHTHNRNINPLENKLCEIYIFINKCVPWFIEPRKSSLIMFLVGSMGLYNIIQFSAECQFTSAWRGIEPEFEPRQSRKRSIKMLTNRGKETETNQKKERKKKEARKK